MSRIGFARVGLSLVLGALSALAPGCGASSGLEVGDAAVAIDPDAGPIDPDAGPMEPDAGPTEPDAGPIDVAPHLVATFRATCVLDDESRCWGEPSVGTSLGATPTRVPELDRMLDLRMGSSFRCALRPDGRVLCAGSNYAGQLGVDPSTLESRATLALVPGLDDVVEIALDGSHACARRSDGSVWCWGQNATGEVGRPMRDHASGASVAEWEPRPVAGISGAISIAAGSTHSCAAVEDGTVACWGYGSFGQLGRGRTTPPTSEPAPVVGLDDAIAIDARGSSTCALRANGTVWCFGRHTEGQLGIAEEDVEECVNVVPHPCATSPRRVVGVEGAREMVFGGVLGCARTETGGRCWGRVGELGTVLEIEPDAIELAGGSEHACVRTASGRVRCTGRGTEGQLGDGAMESRRGWVDAAL